jgi:hypothetical protein
VGKILHHFIPLSRESLLKQHVNKMFSSVVFIFFLYRGFVGHMRVSVLKRDKIETQLVVLEPHQGHALKNDQEQPNLIPLIRIIFGTK